LKYKYNIYSTNFIQTGLVVKNSVAISGWCEHSGVEISCCSIPILISAY